MTETASCRHLQLLTRELPVLSHLVAQNQVEVDGAMESTGDLTNTGVDGLWRASGIAIVDLVPTIIAHLLHGDW